MDLGVCILQGLYFESILWADEPGMSILQNFCWVMFDSEYPFYKAARLGITWWNLV